MDSDSKTYLTTTSVVSSQNTAVQAPSGPLKTYTLINSGVWTKRHLELQQNDRTIFWVNASSGFLSRPQVALHEESQKGPIAVTARFKAFGSGVRVHVGNNPDAVPKDQWSDVDGEGFTTRQYSFACSGGKRFVWRRTHDPKLGASSWMSSDFKLLDLADERKVLAAYVTSRKAFSVSQVGRIDVYAELERDVELTALAAILGVEERLRRRKASSGAAGGAGGGAGA